MRLFLLLIVAFLPLHAEVEVRPDKTSLHINQKLGVTIFFSESAGLFELLYELENSPQTSFRLVDSSVVDNKTVHLSLAPMHTGRLIFAPGVVQMGGKSVLIPAFSVNCESVDNQNLPFAGLLPLYPERRIDLSEQNRLMLIDKQLLNKVKIENESAFSTYRRAWDSLGLFFGTIAVGVLLVWCIIYYDLIERAKRAPPVQETPLEKLIQELKDPNQVGWQTLANALREALTVRLDHDFYRMSLPEVADYVAKEDVLQASDKELLVPFIQSLGAICYAGRPATKSDLLDMVKTFLLWNKELLWHQY